MLNHFNKLEKTHQVIFALVISIAVISVWRGIWGLLDYYLLPGSPVMSYVTSIIIGVTILFVTGFAVKELE